MKLILIMIALFASTQAQADDATKRAKIEKLLVVQGMEQMIQQQMDQAAGSVGSMGEKVFNTMVGDTAKANPEALKKLRAIHDKFLQDASKMFTAKEVVDVWSAEYGKDLTESDLDKILAYYVSPTGQKDIASSKNAMTAFGKLFSDESEKRVMRLMTQFHKDLTAAVKL